MSATVLVIALVPAALALIIGVASNNRFILFVVAVIAGAVGVVGNPAYMMIDLVFVVIAFFFGLSIIGNQNPTAQQKPLSVVSAPVAEEKINEDSSWVWIVVGLVFVGFFLNNDKKADHPAQAPPVQEQQKGPQLTAPSPSATSLHRPENSPKHAKSPSSDMRDCLDLSSNEAIQKCAQKSGASLGSESNAGVNVSRRKPARDSAPVLKRAYPESQEIANMQDAQKLESERLNIERQEITKNQAN